MPNSEVLNSCEELLAYVAADKFSILDCSRGLIYIYIYIYIYIIYIYIYIYLKMVIVGPKKE